MNSKSSNSIISPALPEHYARIAEIYNETVLYGLATMEERAHQAKDIAEWVRQFNDRERLYVSIKEGTVIGWGIIKKYSDRSGYRFAGETAVYFTQDQLGKGYGSQMKKHLIAVCKDLKYHHLIAKIFSSNHVSINYNIKLGYTIVGQQKEIGFKNNRWMDVTILQLLID